MSQVWAIARPLPASIRPTVSRAASARMSNTPTTAPSSANRLQIARPIPLPPPVTIAVFPLIPLMRCTSFNVGLIGNGSAYRVAINSLGDQCNPSYSPIWKPRRQYSDRGIEENPGRAAPRVTGRPVSAPTPLGILVGRLAQTDPSRAAITCGQLTISRAELEARTNRLARAYRDLGVRQDSFVTIGLPNGIEFLEATLAAWKLGATPQPMSSRLPAAACRAIANLANPSLVVGVEPA